MLIKFFAQGQGAGRGAVEYCTRHDDPISRQPRQPAPEVIRGDPALTIALIDGKPDLSTLKIAEAAL